MSGKTGMTVEELERLPEDEGVWRELDAGERIEAPGPLTIHSFIRDNTTKLLGIHLEERLEQGFVVAEQHLRLSEAPQPEVALAGRDQFPLIDGEGVQSFAPQLVAKIGSPTNMLRDINRKIRQYLKAGDLTA